jgi:uncharacterized protein
LLVDESGSEIAHAAREEAAFTSTSAVAHIEATAALTRMRRGGRISPRQFDTGLSDLERLWDSLFTHAVTDRLIEAASSAARNHALRAYDALHLATVTSFQEVRQLTLACWDRELRDAASKCSISLIPERL